MQKLKSSLFLTFLSVFLSGQTYSQSSNIIAIDHIPIAVKNLNNTKKELSETLHFTVKEGKAHEGIQNCFVKFQDGTYLEFLTPTDNLQSIGKYYSDFLKVRQGGTLLAISVRNSETIIDFFKKKKIPSEIDSNKIWKTVEPNGFGLLFIDYADKDWKDSKINTSHPNEAISLKSTYIIDTKQNSFAKKYKALGFSGNKKGELFSVPYKTLLVGKSNLNFLNASKANKIISKFNSKNFVGICGFEIKVRSLEKLEKLLPNAEKIIKEKGKIIYFLSDKDFFLEFTE